MPMWRLAAAIDPQALHAVAYRLPYAPPRRCVRRVSVGGAELCGYAGLAAGLDKTGSLTWLASLFAGFAVVGSVTLRPRRGNAGRVLVRCMKHLAAVNSVGLPSPGMARLTRRIAVSASRFPVILSVAGFNEAELLATVRIASKLPVAAIEANLSSPTYRGAWASRRDLLDRLNEAADGKPLFVKLSPLEDTYAWARVAGELGVGLTLVNTWPIRTRLLDVGYGGLSGAPLYRVMVRRVEAALRVFDGPVMAVGGICSCRQAHELARLGASAIQALTCPAILGLHLLARLGKCFEEGLKK